MLKKKPTNVKSKKKKALPEDEESAYKNRVAVEEEDDEDMEIDDEIDEVGLEKDENEKDDDF